MKGFIVSIKSTPVMTWSFILWPLRMFQDMVYTLKHDIGGIHMLPNTEKVGYCFLSLRYLQVRYHRTLAWTLQFRPIYHDFLKRQNLDNRVTLLICKNLEYLDSWYRPGLYICLHRYKVFSIRKSINYCTWRYFF